MKEQNDEKSTKNSRTKLWLKRFGLAGFLFFLIKGLIWIAVGVFAVKGCEQ